VNFVAGLTGKIAGFGGRIRRFYRESKSELKKVTWISRKQLISHTGVVIAAVFLISVFIWLVDSVFSLVINAVTK